MRGNAMMLTGYVITDTRSADASATFWSPFPKLVTAIQHRVRHAETPMWDYWSTREEMQHRSEHSA